MGVLQVRGCSLIKRKIPFSSRSTALPQKERKKTGGRRAGERERKRWRLRGGEKDGASLLLARERRGRDQRESTRLPGWLARYVSGMHARRPFLSPRSRILPPRAIRVVFFFFLHHFCSRLFLFRLLKSDHSCVLRRNSDFFILAYCDNFGGLWLKEEGNSKVNGTLGRTINIRNDFGALQFALDASSWCYYN